MWARGLMPARCVDAHCTMYCCLLYLSYLYFGNVMYIRLADVWKSGFPCLSSSLHSPRYSSFQRFAFSFVWKSNVIRCNLVDRKGVVIAFDSLLFFVFFLHDTCIELLLLTSCISSFIFYFDFVVFVFFYCLCSI